MRHPTEGVLRRLVDEPAAVGIGDREHVLACDGCLRSLETIRSDAARVATAMATDVDVDTSHAWNRLAAAAAAGDSGSVVRLHRARLRETFRRPAIAGAAVALVLAGAGTAAANDWLPIFRSEEVAPVTITSADLNALPDLSAYGEVQVISAPQIHEVADADEAEAETGLDVPDVADLPRGVSGDPRYQVGREAAIEFMFSAERAAQTAAHSGVSLPPPPPGVDGAKVRFVGGPGVAQVWSKSGAPVLIVGRAVAPAAFTSSDVSFETLRDYVLSLPGLPENVAASLRTFNADATTLPLPVLTDRFVTSSAEVGDDDATVLTTRDSSMSAVVWIDDGVMTVVAGALDSGEVLSVARGLK